MNDPYAHDPRFAETRWSVVNRANSADEEVRSAALSDLLKTYMPGLTAFLVRTRRLSPDVAEDMVNSFIADKILARAILKHAQKERGKFRNFLLKSLTNYVNTLRRREASKQAMVVPLDELNQPASDDDEEKQEFDREWVQQVVQHALQSMKAECCDSKGRSRYRVFELRMINPIFHGHEPATYSQIVEELKIATPREAINLLGTAKRCFIRHFRSAVSRYTQGDANIDAEIEELLRIMFGE